MNPVESVKRRFYLDVKSELQMRRDNFSLVTNTIETVLEYQINRLKIASSYFTGDISTYTYTYIYIHLHIYTHTRTHTQVTDV